MNNLCLAVVVAARLQGTAATTITTTSSWLIDNVEDVSGVPVLVVVLVRFSLLLNKNWPA